MNPTEKQLRYQTIALLKRKEKLGAKKMTLLEMQRAIIKGQRGPNKAT